MLTTTRRKTCLLCTPVRRSLLGPARASFHASSFLGRQKLKDPRMRFKIPASVIVGRGPDVDLSLTPKIKDQATKHPAYFKSLVHSRLRLQANALKNTPVFEGMGLDVRQKYAAWDSFVRKLESDYVHYASPTKDKAEDSGGLWKTLQQALQDRGPKGLDKQLETSFLGHLAASKLIDKDLFSSQRAMADLRYPTEWFARTRTSPRKIIMHVGPTNSGKTYHALKRLEEKGGVYAGPLRLLAHEVYTRMNAKGIPANLVTGEERRRSPHDGDLQVTACTVEMVPLAQKIGVAVIDEIQMIGHIERGWAWTQAVLGVQADEVHLCGETRSVPLIKSLAASMGEEFEIRNYERLTPLNVDKGPIGIGLKDLRPGDCIVAFSKVDIHAIKAKIQNRHGLKVAIVYGSLPPETRAAQARLFNDPDSGYDILVASDAVGMGLNLSIKRIIFNTTYKFNGFEVVRLALADFKQIAGRAGRFKTAHQANKDAQATRDGTLNQEAEENPGGLVTAIEKDDFNFVKANLTAEPAPLKTAGIFPPDAIVEKFATFFPPRTPFSFILLQLVELAKVHDRFHMCMLRDQVLIADVIQCVDGLSVSERLTFCISPAAVSKPGVSGGMAYENKLLIEMARCVGEHKSGALLDIPGFGLECLDTIEINASDSNTVRRQKLGELERLHKSLVLYLWLSYRFSGVFSTRTLAFKAKELVETAIEKLLARQAQKVSKHLDLRRKAMKRSSQSTKDYLGESLDGVEPHEQQGESGALLQGSFNETDEVFGIPEEAIANEVADEVADEVAGEDEAVDQQVEASEDSGAISKNADGSEEFWLSEELSGNQEVGGHSTPEKDGQQAKEDATE